MVVQIHQRNVDVVKPMLPYGQLTHYNAQLTHLRISPELKRKGLTAATPLRQAHLDGLKESGMSIKIGDKVRHAVTHEEGAVVAISNDTPTCVEVRFSNSLPYLIATKELELVATPTRVRQRFS